MATFTERLAILVSADTRGAVRELDALGRSSQRSLAATEGAAGGVAARLDRAGSQMIVFGAQAATAGAVASAGLFQVARSAAQLEDSVQASDVIFGADLSRSIDEFARNAADKLGLSRREATETLTQFATFGKGAGLQGRELLTFSETLTKVAVDLGSLKGLTTQEVVGAIGSGLAGEIEPLRRLGIQITDVQKRAEAVRLGLRRAGDKAPLTAEQNTLATASLIQSSPLGRAAQGDFERTIESLPNKLKVAQANFDNLKVSVGTGIVPAFADLADRAAGVARAFEALPEPLRQTLGSVAAFGALGTTAVGALSVVGGAASKVIGRLAELRSAAQANGLASLVTGASGATKGFAAAAAATVTWGVALNELSNQTKRAYDAMLPDPDAIKAAFDPSQPERFGQLIDELVPRLGKLVDSPTNALDKLGQKFGTYDFTFFGLFESERDQDRVEAQTETLDRLRAGLEGLDATTQRDFLGKLAASMRQAGVPMETVTETVGTLLVELGNAESAARATAAASTELGSSASAAASGLNQGATAAERYANSVTEALSGIRAANEGISNADAFTQATTQYQAPARAALGYESALLRVQEAQEKLNELSDPKNRQREITGALKRVASANDEVSDAIERRRQAQEELDRLTKRSAVAGSVPLIQEIAKAADAGVKDAQAKVDQALATYGEGSREVAVARKGLEGAAGRRTESLGLLDRALQEQGGRNAAEIRNAQRQLDQANRGIADAVTNRQEAEADYADVLSDGGATARQRRQAEIELQTAVLDAGVAYATFTGYVADGVDPLGRLADEMQRARDAGIITAEQFDALSTSMATLATTAQQNLGWIAPLLQTLATAPAGPSAGGLFGILPPVSSLVPSMTPTTVNPQAPATSGMPWYAPWYETEPSRRPAAGGGGGGIRRFAEGGTVPGVGSGDSVPAMLTPGEFVVTKSATAAIGTEALRALNKGRATVQKFAAGGLVRGPRSVPAFPSGSSTSARPDGRTVEVRPTFNIMATDPKKAADESVRKLRRATFLAGVR